MKTLENGKRLFPLTYTDINSAQSRVNLLAIRLAAEIKRINRWQKSLKKDI